MNDLAALLKRERGRLVALLARRYGLGAWGLAEDAVQAATLAALTKWPAHGWPAQPAAWLYRSAQHHLIDQWRRERREAPLSAALGAAASGGEAGFAPAGDVAGRTPAHAELTFAAAANGAPDFDATEADFRTAPTGRFAGELADDELALLFAACHPALPPATQVALALRAQSDLDLVTIAEALLTTEAALAQRLARARETLRGQPLSIPAGAELPPRRQSVLAALQAMFNAGWDAGAGDPRRLCWEAIRLARAVAGHPATAHPDAEALAATLLLHGARLTGRHDAQGEIVPLPGQPRDRWDAAMVRMGLAHLQRAQVATALSRWHLLAGIAAEHALAPDYARTAWPRIVAYYELLLQLDPSAPPRLGHAIALAEGGAPVRAEALLRALLPRVPQALAAHTHAALAHVRQQQGDAAEATESLRQAVALARHEADRRLLQRRLEALRGPA